ncbi:MAG: hypothetical protein LUF27_01260 [Lachnospiraceae bacterium]|nr:hypothetical protein [Lachnospiraceae bacterium]
MKKIGKEVEELRRQLREAEQNEKQERKAERQRAKEEKQSARERQRRERKEEKAKRQQEHRDEKEAREQERRRVKENRQKEREEKKEKNRKESRERRFISQEEREVRRDMGKDARNSLEIGYFNKEESQTGQEVELSAPARESDGSLDFLPLSWAAPCLPVEKIENGIIYTTDGRYVKIIEVLPINFLLRSAAEQRSIISSFVSYLKIAPDKIQFKEVAKKADIADYLSRIRAEIDREEDPHCRILQEDYMRLIRDVGTREAITRRFFLVFEYDGARSKKPSDKEVYLHLKNQAQTARKYLSMCGNQVVVPQNGTAFSVDLLYQLLNRKTSVAHPLADRVQEAAEWYRRENGRASLSHLPVTELIAPKTLDFRHMNYVVMDDVYHAYLFIPSHKYRSRVPAGWLSLLINAGEGIDVDLYVYRQDKARSMERIGRKIRLNRSKIKDTYDTNRDYDELSESIRSGYYLKNGLSGSEDFYYICVLVTVTANSVKELDWRVKELNKLLYSQDISTVPCTFREEEAFLSALPLLALDKSIYQRSKRNALTSGVASCYPLVSYEMSDKDGILMGVNKLNSSLVIVDIFNSALYKNANIAIMGTSGAGKTFTMQLMALRMRRKNIQVFIIAPDKGHEFARAARNIGGAYIQISPGSANCINVMEIRAAASFANELLDGQAGERSELALKIQSLHIFFSLLIPDMTYEEKQLLDTALMETYRRKGITHDNRTLWNGRKRGQYKEMPVLGDLYQVLLERGETRRMANILNRLVNGSASSFNQLTNVDLGNRYVVLDISELSGDLLLGMFVALDYVWTQTKRDRTKEKAIFIDEVWKLLSNEMAASYVLEIFKTIRGYGGAAVCATQDLVDFFSLQGGKYGKGILGNSKTKIILNLENREAERIRDELDLSEAEVQAIQKFERGNGLISTNSNNLLVEFRASSLERDLITTDRKDLMRLKERIEKYGDAAYGKRE